MKSTPITILIMVFLLACNKENDLTEKKLVLKELWSIPADNRFLGQDGVIYKDEYLLFAQTEDCQWFLEAYDLRSLEKKWEHKFEDFLGGWISKIRVGDDILYLDDGKYVIEVFDLIKKKSIKTVRFLDVPEISSTRLSSDYQVFSVYHDGKVYRSLTDRSDDRAMILSIDTKTGALEKAFEWENDLTYRQLFGTPLFLEDEVNGGYDMFLTVSYYQSLNPPDATTLFISVNDDNSINWMDTLETNFLPPAEYPPIAWKNAIILNGRKSYNKITGQRNWTSDNQCSGRIANVEDELYFIDTEMSRIDGNNGNQIWKSRFLTRLSILNHPTVFKDKLFYIRDDNDRGSGPLVLLNRVDGERVSFEPFNYGDVGHPQFYEKENIYITHQAERIIAFTFE
ncbi:MAG: hypothetical protein AAGI49_01305 [Bacteroidota bacterium]